MKLVNQVTIRLSLAIIPLMIIWGALFYFRMMEEINDETDDALDLYAEQIIIRVLAGQRLPSSTDGTNNTYIIKPVSQSYADTVSRLRYFNEDIFIPEKEETEPARTLVTIFQDKNGTNYELRVSSPTFERDDLLYTILYWISLLYITLAILIIIICIFVFRTSLTPFYKLLHWLDNHKPGGNKLYTIDIQTNITEFNKLKTAAQNAVNRSEELRIRENEFIGNASHELQTPLAILNNQIEWMLESNNFNETQMTGLVNMRRTLSSVIRLNKTLLLLSKIEGKQYYESEEINIKSLIEELINTYADIFESKSISVEHNLSDNCTVMMNTTLANVLFSNLIKNAFVHSDQYSLIRISSTNHSISFSNQGNEPLDESLIFNRFYSKRRNNNSSGLGLSLVNSIVKLYNMNLKYKHDNGWHQFLLSWGRNKIL